MPDGDESIGGRRARSNWIRRPMMTDFEGRPTVHGSFPAAPGRISTPLYRPFLLFWDLLERRMLCRAHGNGNAGDRKTKISELQAKWSSKFYQKEKPLRDSPRSGLKKEEKKFSTQRCVFLASSTTTAMQEDRQRQFSIESVSRATDGPQQFPGFPRRSRKCDRNHDAADPSRGLSAGHR
ncbi:hypothetical protein K0M31_007589 [Melipona bicolor]|uniref:Uncharacterized protein n=1 Tax=Melipona bicolor TaxID=60889 RepID=A0AA40KW55_9HYME|nr:hypothetical protein K0M31_007589 [Melipona bicolor]